MKKLILVKMLGLCFAFSSYSQTFEWVNQMGGTNYDEGKSMTVDATGNVYTTGYFSGTVDFDPGTGTFNLTSTGGADAFVSKVDANGNFVWAVQWGGADLCTGMCIKVDASGNIYTSGYFGSTVDFDPGTGIYNLTDMGYYDAFISKLDASGNLVWAKQIGGPNYDLIFSLAIDALGNVYTTGYFSDIADLDPGAATFNLTSAGTQDIFVLKLNAAGDFVWAKQMGGTMDENPYSIGLDATGNVYTTGTFQGTADFDPGAAAANLTVVGSEDVFISKLDASGNFVWAKQLGGNDAQGGYALAVDATGNVYTTGRFRDNTDFDPGAGTFYLTTSSAVFDIFVCKLDASGNFVWAKQMGGNDNNSANAIALDASGNIYTTGYFYGTVDFNPGAGTFNLIAPPGNINVFVSKLDPSGNFASAVQMGNSTSAQGKSITVDGAGNIYTTGAFDLTMDFDPGAGISNLTSLGYTDVFVHKMSQAISSVTETKPAFHASVYPNPTASTLTIQTDEAIREILIHDMMGSLVQTENKNNFSVQSLLPGVYLIQIKTTNSNGALRFIKQ